MNNYSQIIKTENDSKHISQIVKMPKNDVINKEGGKPNGLFGHKVIVTSGSVKLENDYVDMEFSIPFDNNLEPNEAEIKFYNLSKDTIKGFKSDAVITVTAGYGNDTGIIFNGRIRKIKTKYESVDKVTTIYALDDQSMKDRELQEIAYAANVKSSYILKDLLKRTGLPIAIFKVQRDFVNKDSTKIDGSLINAISDYAKDCGVDVYIQKGKIYALDVRKASKDINFTICPDTGLIGSPEEFEEEVEEENYTETIKGYKIEMLLQYKIEVGVKIRLNSKNVTGNAGIFSVRSGEHSYNGSEMITSIEVVM